MLLPSPAEPDDSLSKSVGLARTFVDPFSMLASNKPKKDLFAKVDPGLAVLLPPASGKVGK